MADLFKKLVEKLAMGFLLELHRQEEAYGVTMENFELTGQFGEGRNYKLSMEIVIAHDFKLVEKVGQGAYGMIYKALQVSSGRHVAVKLEKASSPIPQVFYEAKVYSKLQGKRGIPKLHFIGIEGDFNVLVVEL